MYNWTIVTYFRLLLPKAMQKEGGRWAQLLTKCQSFLLILDNKSKWFIVQFSILNQFLRNLTSNASFFLWPGIAAVSLLSHSSTMMMINPLGGGNRFQLTTLFEFRLNNDSNFYVTLSLLTTLKATIIEYLRKCFGCIHKIGPCNRNWLLSRFN